MTVGTDTDGGGDGYKRGRMERRKTGKEGIWRKEGRDGYEGRKEGKKGRRENGRKEGRKGYEGRKEGRKEERKVGRNHGHAIAALEGRKN
jgi:ATP-dependent RNA helicase RhlE